MEFQKRNLGLYSLLIVACLLAISISRPASSVKEAHSAIEDTSIVFVPVTLNLYPRQLGDLFGSALFFNNVDAYATAADNSSLDLGSGNGEDFTLETFFYVPDSNNTTTDTLIYKQGSYALYILYNTTSPDRFIYRIWTSPIDYVYLFANVDLTVGWHHVAAIFDNEYTSNEDLLALYVDGSLEASSTAVEFTPGILNSSSAVYLGGYLGLNSADSWLEETRFSNSVRYSGSSFTVPSATFADDTNTQALWHFNEPAGSTTMADSSGNANTLTALNGAQTGNP